MTKNRIISFILLVVFLFSTTGSSVYAITNNNSTVVKEKKEPIFKVEAQEENEENVLDNSVKNSDAEIEQDNSLDNESNILVNTDISRMNAAVAKTITYEYDQFNHLNSIKFQNSIQHLDHDLNGNLIKKY